MSLRKSLLIFAGAILLVALLFVIATPFAVAVATKMWITRTARQQGLNVTFGSIDAPLFRPVVIRNARITSATSKNIYVEITRAELDLRVAAYFDSSRGRVLRNLSINGLRGEIDTTPVAQDARQNALPFVQRLVADNFDVSSPSLRLHFRGGSVATEDLIISGSEIESGTFRVARLSIATLGFQKTFGEIRGATSWQLDRLTIGGLTLIRGLDVDVIAFDLAQLAHERVGIDANVDVFGGKLRVSVSTENSGNQRVWDIAASGTEISLGRMSDALDFSNRTSGSVHALKLTFRGEFADLTDATASLWTEVSGLTWRDRTAEIVMLGASLYSRQIQVEQLYVKQRKNELTLSGESDLPQPSRGWPEFRGDVSAAIGDLGDFARLFGGSAADFGGQINVDGVITEAGKTFAGQVVTSGSSLTLFGVPVDALEARIAVAGATGTIESAMLRQAATTANLRGRIDLADPGATKIELVSDRAFAAAIPPNCVDRIDLATAAHSPADRLLVDRLEFRGPLLKSGWALTLDNSRGDNAQRTAEFCTDETAGGGTLTLTAGGR